MNEIWAVITRDENGRIIGIPSWVYTEQKYAEESAEISRKNWAEHETTKKWTVEVKRLSVFDFAV